MKNKNKSALWIIGIIILVLFFAKNDLMFATFPVDSSECDKWSQSANLPESEQLMEEACDEYRLQGYDCNVYQAIDRPNSWLACAKLAGSVDTDCTDNDGKNYFNKGRVIQWGFVNDDVCGEVYGWAEGTVIEYYCDTEYGLASELYACPSGICENGACVREGITPPIPLEEFECIDLDNGKKYKIASSCTTIFPDGTKETFEDECFEENELWEFYCSTDPAFEGKACKVDMYDCLYGCKDGRCLSQEEKPTPPKEWYEEYWWAIAIGVFLFFMIIILATSGRRR